MRDSSSLFLFSTVIYTSGRLAVLADGNIFAPLDDTDGGDVIPGSSTITTPALSKSPKECGRAGYVDCLLGFVRDDADGTTCEQACEGKCCVGMEACTSFTGIVCQDGSCSSSYACSTATIALVMNSCLGGG
jgi:hypothetical protein